jgi:hypothetical protein
MTGFLGSADSIDMPSDTMTIDINFQDLGSVLCNLSVNATAQCLMDIELGSISKQIAMIELSRK